MFESEASSTSSLSVQMFQIPASQMSEHLHGYRPMELGTVGTVGGCRLFSNSSQIVNMSA
eukprot:365143-Chlamydomonas_euryale.AAC.4